MFCLVLDTNNHHTVPLTRDRERKKAELGAKMKLMIQERQLKIEEIRRSAELSSKSADRHIADSERVLKVLLQSVMRSQANLIDAINEKRNTTHKQADKFIQELEREISELTKRSNNIDQLSQTDNNFDFSNNYIPTTKNWTEVTIHPPSYEASVGVALNRLEEEFSTEKKKLIAKAKLHRVQEFAKDVTLDPDTANPFLILSDNKKQVYCGDAKQTLPENPKRFNTATNVLGEQSFSSGRFYFEVQVTGKTSWDVGVVKESIRRSGSISASPESGYWTICLRNGDKYKAFSADLSVKYQLKKVGVFVDYENGSVSFHDVDSADIIHSFSNCSFTGRLYPFFSPGSRHGGKNSAPLIISPVNYADQI